MNSFLTATIDSLVRTPAGRFHMWAGASRSLERFRLLRYLVPWVGCKRPCSKEPCIDSQEGEQRKSHIEC